MIVAVMMCVPIIGSDRKTFTPAEWQKLTPKQQQAWKEKHWVVQPMPIVGKSKAQEIGDRGCGQQICWMQKPQCHKPQCPKEKKEKHHHHHHKVKKCGPCGGKGISQKDVNKKGTGFIITKSGEYFLEKDIAFDPSVPNAAAITIDADNVVLHLCNKTLSQESDNSQPGTMGILVNGRENVSIDGGTIRDFIAYGIFSNPGSNIFSLNDINVINCGTIAEGPVGGVLLLPSDSITVTNCNFIENFGVGFDIAGCTNFVMDHCACNGTKGSQVFPVAGATAALGFLAQPFPLIIPLPNATTCENIVITNSTFNGSNATATVVGAVFGGFFSVDQVKNILVENCVSMGSIGGALSDEVEGFSLLASNAVIRNCVVDTIISGAGTPFSGLARAFRCLGKNVVYENCVASNVTGSGPASATGFSGEYTTEQVTWRNCVAYNITNIGTPTENGNADAYGFGSVIIAGFLIPQFIISPIFDVNFATGNVFEGCIAENITVTGDGSTAAGFRFSSQQNIDVQNCVSNNNQHYGFWMEDEAGFPSTNGIIQSNTIEGNGSAGIEDDTSDANAYIANIARSNNCPGNNYVGVPAGTPIATWIIPGPVPTINPLDNLDICP